MEPNAKARILQTTEIQNNRKIPDTCIHLVNQNKLEDK